MLRITRDVTLSAVALVGFLVIVTDARAEPNVIQSASHVSFHYDPSVFKDPHTILINEYVFKMGILACKNSQRTNCIVQHMPLASQSDPRIDADVQSQSGVGCYNTSIATVVATALANRSPQASPLINRTKEFNDMQAGKDASGADIPKFIKQISWQYRNQINNSVYYFHETTADIGGGKISESCDPYSYGKCKVATAVNGLSDAERTFLPDKSVTLANKDIIALMKTDHVTMIAFRYYASSGTYDAATQTLTVSLTAGNRHKVVYSGFDASQRVFPLLINNVGDGKRYMTRLTTDLGQLKFAAPGMGPVTKIVYPPEIQGRTLFVKQKDQDTINPTVLVVEHYDRLKIKPANILRPTSNQKKT